MAAVRVAAHVMKVGLDLPWICPGSALGLRLDPPRINGARVHACVRAQVMNVGLDDEARARIRQLYETARDMGLYRPGGARGGAGAGACWGGRRWEGDGWPSRRGGKGEGHRQIRSLHPNSPHAALLPLPPRPLAT